jgi:hypothetical protein
MNEWAKNIANKFKPHAVKSLESIVNFTVGTCYWFPSGVAVITKNHLRNMKSVFGAGDSLEVFDWAFFE